jgi:hypothetical protein
VLEYRWGGRERKKLKGVPSPQEGWPRGVVVDDDDEWIGGQSLWN